MHITKRWRRFGIAAAAGAIVLTGLAVGGTAQAATDFTLDLSGGGHVTVGCTPGTSHVLSASQAEREYQAVNNCRYEVLLFTDPEHPLAVRPHSTARHIKGHFAQILVTGIR